MRLHIRCQTDFWAGVLFFAFGIAAMAIARGYPVGKLQNMGPGYFPVLLGAILAGLGAIISLRALLVHGLSIDRMSLRPIAIVIGSIVSFAVSITTIGFIPAVFIVVVFSSCASEAFQAHQSAVLASVLAILSSIIFIWGLALPIKLIG